MILEACIDWDDPSLPMIGIHGERLPRRRPARSFGPGGGEEHEPSPALDLLLSHLADTDSIVHEHVEDEWDYRVTLYRVRGDYCRALRIETHWRSLGHAETVGRCRHGVQAALVIRSPPPRPCRERHRRDSRLGASPGRIPSLE